MSDKAKFHGEATMREEFGHLNHGRIYSSPNCDRDDYERMVYTLGGKLLRRTVTTSQWVEVDA